jgi:hypothetical protein
VKKPFSQREKGFIRLKSVLFPIQILNAQDYTNGKNKHIVTPAPPILECLGSV